MIKKYDFKKHCQRRQKIPACLNFRDCNILGFTSITRDNRGQSSPRKSVSTWMQFQTLWNFKTWSRPGLTPDLLNPRFSELGLGNLSEAPWILEHLDWHRSRDWKTLQTGEGEKQPRLNTAESGHLYLPRLCLFLSIPTITWQEAQNPIRQHRDLSSCVQSRRVWCIWILYIY